MNGNYIMIPREIIEMKNLFPTRLAVFVYLATRRALDDKAYIMLHDLVIASGYKPDKNKQGINKKFISTLDSLEGLGYFVKAWGEYSGLKPCILQLNIYKFDVLKSFACVSLAELNALRNFKSKSRSVSFDKLLLVLCYIRVNKLRRSEYQQAHPQNKPEFFYRHIDRFASDIMLSIKTVTACIAVLEELNIIVSRPMQRYQDPYGNWHTDYTLFADKTNDWAQELEWGEHFLLKKKNLIP